MIAVGLALLLITLANAKDSVRWSARVKSDPAVNFCAYKTSFWLNVHAHSAPWVLRIKSSIDATLASKGWNHIASGGDVSIVVLEMTKEHETLTSY